MGWNFFDTDHEIESAEKATIAELFEQRGEPEFRRIEAEILRQHVRWIERGRPAVLALGGGAFAEQANRELLAEHGISVWLDCPFETVKRRVAQHARGSAAGARPREVRRVVRSAPRDLCARRRARQHRIGRSRNDRRRDPGGPDFPMSTRQLRRHALAIFRASLAAADPDAAVVRHLKPLKISGDSATSTWSGAGKAGASMAKAAERVLGRRITAGLINVKDGHTAKLRRIELNECGHPVPDSAASTARSASPRSQRRRRRTISCSA